MLSNLRAAARISAKKYSVDFCVEEYRSIIVDGSTQDAGCHLFLNKKLVDIS